MSVPQQSGGPGWVVALVYASMVFIWGTTWLVIRIGLEYYPPFFSLGVRFTVAATLLLLIMRVRGDRFPLDARSQGLFAVLSLLTFVISFGIVYWGEQYLSSGLTAIIFALMPLFTCLMAHFTLHEERLRPAMLGGLLISLAGIIVINLADLSLIHPRAPLAAGLMIISPLVVAAASVISKKHLASYPHLAFSAFPMAYAAVVHLILWRVFEADVALAWSWPGVGAIAYLVVLGSIVTFASYYWLLIRVPVSRLNLTAYLTPLIAVVVGITLGGEHLTPMMTVGAVLVLVGVGLAGGLGRARARKQGRP